MMGWRYMTMHQKTRQSRRYRAGQYERCSATGKRYLTEQRRYPAGRSKHRLIKSLLICILAMVVLVAVLTVIQSFSTRHQETQATDSTATPLTTDKALLDTYGFTASVYVLDSADTRTLELINNSHPITRELDSSLLVPAWRTASMSVASTDTEEVALHETALNAVNDMFAAASNAGIDTLIITSGYRDRHQQQQAYDEAPDKSFAQKPNYSEHQTGLAADIFTIGTTQYTMAASYEAQWLAENSWRYGLILRYPEGKQNTTGIAYEPWHFRYVGQPHAWFCWQNNLCLEEYLQYLKTCGGYQISLDGKVYSVLYQVPEDGLLYVPRDQGYTISGDNAGGYVVTAWKQS